VPWNPKRQKNRSCLPPTWTKEELGKRSSIERFFGRVFLFFRLQRPPFSGWSAIVAQVALTYTATIVVALAAWQANRPDLIRSPKRVLAHLWEESELGSAMSDTDREADENSLFTGEMPSIRAIFKHFHEMYTFL
jgi:hypothetical protein